VCHPNFGAEFQTDLTLVIDVFLSAIQPELAHRGRLSAVQVTQLLHKAYLVRYGLATKDELTLNPASLVKLRPAEDAYVGTLLEDHFEHFLDLEIFQYMEWDAYISKPRHELEMIRRLAEKRRRKKNTQEAHTASELEKMQAAMRVN
jgi:hypothetical protein